MRVSFPPPRAYRWIIAALAASAVLGGAWLAKVVLRSDTLDAMWPWDDLPGGNVPPTQPEIVAIAAALLEAGLTAGPYRESIGVEGHIARVRSGEVSGEVLTQYATDLQTLNRLTTVNGAHIPTTFWDVRDEQMAAGNVTEYALIAGMATPQLATVVGYLGRAYARFVAFKTHTAGDDTALDAALDMLDYAVDYTDTVFGPYESNETPRQRGKRADEAVRLWQSTLVGTTRSNPITGKPMVAETLSARQNVVAMWNDAQNVELHHTVAWGVSGFDERFVGDASNTNQVEHLSISMFLQHVLKEPAAVLNGQEVVELLSGHSHSSAMGRADMALNRAVAEIFVPRFSQDMRGTIARLRCYLHGAGT